MPHLPITQPNPPHSQTSAQTRLTHRLSRGDPLAGHRRPNSAAPLATWPNTPTHRHQCISTQHTNARSSTHDNHTIITQRAMEDPTQQIETQGTSHPSTTAAKHHARNHARNNEINPTRTAPSGAVSPPRKCAPHCRDRWCVVSLRQDSGQDPSAPSPQPPRSQTWPCVRP